MLTDPPMEELMKEMKRLSPSDGNSSDQVCAYELAVLVSKRASQLQEKAQPMIDEDAANAVSLACKELAAGRIAGVPGTLKPDEDFVLPVTKERREELIREANERRAGERIETEDIEPEQQVPSRFSEESLFGTFSESSDPVADDEDTDSDGEDEE